MKFILKFCNIYIVLLLFFLFTKPVRSTAQIVMGAVQ